MFLKPVTSDMENALKRVCPLKKFIFSGNWKLEKTLFERHQNNTAIEVDYLTEEEKNYTVFHFKRPRLF